MFDLNIIISLLSILFLLILSALISASEVALFSLSKSEIEEIKTLETYQSKLLINLLDAPKKLLASILVANNAVNILIVLIFATVGDNLFENLHIDIDLGGFKLPLRFFIEVVVITFLILLFGEVLPKIYATRNGKKFSLFISPFLNTISKILFIFTYPLTSLSKIIDKQLHNNNSNFSLEDLSQALELTSEEETTLEQKNILKGIVNFGNTETVQIMKPRIDICAIPKSASFIDVLNLIKENGFSRNPVYDNNLDEIVGVLYSKDLLPHINSAHFDWHSLLREPFFIPESKKLDDLLIDFQEKKNHLAVVVDEYGGTSGIVTLEDVIEEIVGDISDEFDEENLSYSKIDNYNYVFDGKINIKDFCKVLNINEQLFEKDKGESETLAGLILEISGRFPRKFEKIYFKDFVFTIEVIDKRRIKQIKTSIQHS